jgi:hypothetical protein
MDTQLSSSSIAAMLSAAGWRDAVERTPDILSMLDRIAAEGAAVQAVPVTIAGETMDLGAWVSPVWADHDTVAWREDGVLRAILWAPRGVGFAALDAAAAWMLPDGTVKARVVHRYEHRRASTSDEYRIWRKAVMVSVEEIPGADAECVEAGKRVHPAIVRFLRDDLTAALRADAEGAARHSSGVEAMFANGGEE